MSKLARALELIRGTPDRLEYPTVIQFPVNDICNSRCQMCHIWKKKQKDPIGREELQALASPLFSRVQTVGINGGEPTLRKDLAQIVETLFRTLPRLQGISLITNGINGRQIRERIQEVAEVVHGNNARLDVMVSLDGVGEVHDAVRGREGNFLSALELLQWLQTGKEADALRIGCTVIRQNVFGVHDLLRFCRQNDFYVKFRLGVPHKRLYTDQIVDPFTLDLEERLHFATFLEGIETHYEKDPRQRYFYRSLAGQLRNQAPRRAGCDWQFRGATVTSRGEVLYCAVESPVVAKLDDPDLTERYLDGQPIIDRIRRDKCADCQHDYMGPPPAPDGIKILAETALDRAGMRDIIGGAAQRLGLGSAKQKKRIRHLEQLAARPLVSDAGQANEKPFVICGWYGTETLGDKAILAGIVMNLRRLDPKRRIIVVSLEPDYTRLTVSQMTELAGVEVCSVEEGLSWASACRAVIFGGGPLMVVDQIVAMRRLFEAAHEGGAAKIIAGCGVGPLGEKVHDDAIANILSLADIRIFRDQASCDAAVRLTGRGQDDRVSCDPAYSWLHGQTIQQNPPAHPTLLLGLRSFPFTEYARSLGLRSGKRLASQLADTMGSVLSTLAADIPDLSILPVPMCANHAGGDDRFFYEQLLSSRKELSRQVDYSLLSRELRPGEYLAAFASATAAFTMRFHSLVFASHCYLPTVAMDYTLGNGKVARLAERLDAPMHKPGELDAAKLYADLQGALLSPKRQVRPADDFSPQFEAAMRRMALVD